MTRAAWRPVAYVLFAIPVVLLAIDMVWAHKWFPEPDATDVPATRTLEDGSTLETTVRQLTLDGKAQRRREVLWGGVLLAGGIAAAGWGLKDLLFPRRVVVVTHDYLGLRLGSRVTMERRYPWHEVKEVRSGVLQDESGTMPVLSLRFVDDSLLPPRPWGAVVDPPWLHLYADEWDRQAHEIAPMIEAHLTPFQTGSAPPAGEEDA